MLIVCIKKRDKNLELSVILACVFLFPFIGLLPTTTIIQTIMIENYAYAESSNNGETSDSILTSFEPNLVGTIKKNATQIMNQDNNSKSRDIEFTSNNVISSKDNLNETSFLSNTPITANITSSNNASAQGASKVNSDFNGDGFSDLAIGVPSEDVGTLQDAGAVNVIYGSSDGINGIPLSPSNGRADQIWTQSITGGVEGGDSFGSALATGDFNNDGFSDLAIGVPNEDIGTLRDTGAVNVIYGSSGGLSSTAKPSQIWTQNSPDIEGGAELTDRFGSKLATGDFNGDGFSDLAIGVPTESIGTIEAAGAVNVIYGSSAGLSGIVLSQGDGRDDQIWTQDSGSGWNDPEFLDLFGSSLTTGDFNKDGFSDLAIGVLFEDIGTIRDAGQVNVIYGASEGLGLGGAQDQIWTQDSPDVNPSGPGDGIEDDPETEDMFGTSLATGDFNNDGFSDLAIGVKGESIGTITVGGAVNVIYGSSFGLIGLEVGQGHGGRPDQIWTQNSPNIEDDSETGDGFGTSLATDDFNKDGRSDLAIGVSSEDVGTIGNAGSVNVIYGSSQGLSSINLSPGNGRADQIWTQNSPNIEDDSEIVDVFGSVLATGDFNKDGILDLAIGVPGEDVVTIGNAGSVNVIYGSLGIAIDSGGLSATVPLGGFGRADQIWTQNNPNIEDDSETDDRFGISLT
jgi:hypothetical protein